MIGSPARIDDEIYESFFYFYSTKEEIRVANISISDRYKKFVEVSLIDSLDGLKSSINRGPRVKKNIRPSKI